MKGLTKRSYRNRVTFLEEAIRRFERTPGMEGAVSRYAEGIGNVYREFEPALAEEWFRRSLSWLAKLTNEPTLRAAFLYWKLGDVKSLRYQCREVLLRTGALLKDTRWLASAANHEVERRRQELPMAHFLSGDYLRAAQSSEDLIAGRSEAEPPYTIYAIAKMASALQSDDVHEFDAGLLLLKDNLKEWPTAESNELVDLYRYACWLRERDFPDPILTRD